MTSSPTLDAVLVVMALAHLNAVLLLAASSNFRIPRIIPGSVRAVAAVLVIFATALVVAELLGFDARASLEAAGAGGVFGSLALRRMVNHSATGALAWFSLLLLSCATALWGVHFLWVVRVSISTRVLLWMTVAMVAITIPSSLLQTLEGWEALLRCRWLRPKDPLVGWRPTGTVPMISVHVPIHVEPPDLVIATLDCLASLDYPCFEVLVVDNNTTDEDLWRPVKRHCEQLGHRFRFFHVEGIAGAKAGALNWVLPHTDARAELVAVVDADYHVHPAWLSHTAGYFDDAQIGFVQCPHAYRDYSGSRFGRMANAEYAVFYATSMVSLSERGAGITVGTMSVIRRRALEEVGGWAEWCLTEDSELAIRLHAAGYRSVYLTKPYGWGLIPQTFDGYKKQRFRWSYGPVQEFKHHVRLFLPTWFAKPSALDRRQRVHHGNHGLDVAMTGLRLLAAPLAGCALVSMITHREVVALPFAIWIAATLTLLSSVAMRWLIYTKGVGQTVRQALGGVIAYLALNHVISVAALTALVGRPARWERTDKFRSPTARNARRGVMRIEAWLGAACIVAAAVALAALPHRGVATALAIGVAWQGINYGAAPVVATIATRDLRRQRHRRVIHALQIHLLSPEGVVQPAGRSIFARLPVGAAAAAASGSGGPTAEG